MKKLTYTEVRAALEDGHFHEWSREVQEEALRTPGPRGWTPLHNAAENGLLSQIPQELLTQENLLKPDDYGWTPFHLAVESKSLGEIPKELLTRENFLTPTLSRFTPLHGAAENATLDQLPPHLLTEAHLLVKDDEGWSPLHYAARDNSLKTLPIKLSLPTLKKLRDWKQTCQESRAWITGEIQKEELRATLKTADHPEL